MAAQAPVRIKIKFPARTNHPFTGTYDAQLAWDGKPFKEFVRVLSPKLLANTDLAQVTIEAEGGTGPKALSTLPLDMIHKIRSGGLENKTFTIQVNYLGSLQLASEGKTKTWLDPKWPIDYMLVARGTPDPTDENHRDDALSMQPGDFGVIKSIPNQNKWLRAIRARGKKSGTVNINYVQIRSLRKYGNIAMNVLASNPTTSIPPTIADANTAEGKTSRLMHTLITLYETLAQKGPAITLDVSLIDTKAKRFQRANEFVAGLRRTNVQLLSKIESFNFTFDDIWQRSRIIAPTDTHNSLYFRRAANFKAGTPFVGSRPKIIVGSTNNARTRDTRHHGDTRAAARSGKGLNHHIVASQAKEYEGRTWCIFPFDTEELLKFHEQTGVLLFETYIPGVLDSNSMRVENDDEAHLSALGSSRQQLHVGHREIEKFQAQFLHGVGQMSKKLSGWPGGCTRSGFGVSNGLNWNSPMCEMTGVIRNRVPWVEYETTSTGTLHFTRPPVYARKAEGDTMKIFDLQKPGVHFKIHLSSAVWKHLGLEIGESLLHQTFEIAKEGTRHPAPFLSNMPENIGWDDREDLLRLGLRIEHQQGGQWKQFYVQIPWPGSRHLVSPKHEESHKYYAFARGALETLLDRKYTGAPSWHSPWEFLVFKLDFDWSEMRVNFRQRPSSAQVPWPTHTSFAENVQKMQELGAQNVGKSPKDKKKFGPRFDADGKPLKYVFSCEQPKVVALAGPGVRGFGTGSGTMRPVNFIGHPGVWEPASGPVRYDNSPPAEAELVDGWVRPDEYHCDFCHFLMWPDGAEGGCPFMKDKTPPDNQVERYGNLQRPNGNVLSKGPLGTRTDPVACRQTDTDNRSINSCGQCRVRGLPCSFTITEDLERNTKLRDFFRSMLPPLDRRALLEAGPARELKRGGAISWTIVHAIDIEDPDFKQAFVD